MGFAKGITAIYYMPDLGETPASVNRKTGEILINQRMWNAMPFEHRVFVLLHEWAHIKCQTSNEFRADEVAFKEYIKHGFSLKASVKALFSLLNFSNPEHLPRLHAQYKRACLHDLLVNGNQKAKPIY